MLDGINPAGLGQLNWLAAVFLGTAILALTIGLVLGLVMWVGGRAAGSGNSSRRGLRMAVGGVAGAIILGSLGGAVQFGSSQGTGSLMVEGARQQSITVDRKAPKTTCTQQAVRDFDEEDPQVSVEARKQLAQAVARGSDFNGLFTSNWWEAQGTPSLVSLKWRPTGPDCSADNTNAAECTDVEAQYYSTSGNERRGIRSTATVTVGEDCEES